VESAPNDRLDRRSRPPHRVSELDLHDGSRGLLSRILGNPRRWRLVDKSIVLAAITLPFRLSNVLMALRVHSMPKAYSLLDPAVLSVWRSVMIAIAAWWCAMIGTGLMIRKRHPESLAFAYTVTLSFWITN